MPDYRFIKLGWSGEGLKKPIEPGWNILDIKELKAHIEARQKAWDDDEAKGKHEDLEGKGKYVPKRPVFRERLNNYAFDDPEFLEWLKAGKNYGVTAAGGLIKLESDDVERWKALGILDLMPSSFTVQSSSPNRQHFYFEGPLVSDCKLCDPDTGEDIGHIRGTGDARGHGGMVVGPGSSHPSGATYKVIKDLPIAKITKETLDKIKIILKAQKVEKGKPKKAKKKDSHVDPFENVTISQVLGEHYKDFHPEGNQMAGPNPYGSHTNQTGHNMVINSDDKCYYCHACEQGGGVARLIAIQGGIMKCDQPGSPKGKDWWATIQYSLEAGLIDEAAAKAAGLDLPVIEPYPEDVISEAMEIAEHGDPLGYMLDSFNEGHIGDRLLAESQFIAFGLQSAYNTMGVFETWAGPSGKGKSAAAKACIRQLPIEYVLAGSITAKSLYHHADEMLDGSVIFLDDKNIEAGSDLEETMKRIQTEFQEGAYHEWLNGNRELMRKRLPRRLLFVRTYVDSIDTDGQLLNRSLNLSVNSSEKVDQEVCELVLGFAEDGKTTDTVTRRTLVCRALWRDIKGHVYRVKMPGIKTLVSLSDIRNRRNPSLFIDLVVGLACIRHHQRDKEPGENEETVLYAAFEDYKEAARIFNSQGDYLSSRLDEAERTAVMVIMDAGESGATIKDVLDILMKKFPNDGWNDKKVRRMLFGRKDRETGGLADKVPGLTSEDRPVYGGRPVKILKFIGEGSKFDLFGLQAVVYTPDEKSLTVSNCPQLPHIFPKMGTLKNDNSEYTTPTNYPNSPKEEYKGGTTSPLEETTSNFPPHSWSGDFGEKPPHAGQPHSEKQCPPAGENTGKNWGNKPEDSDPVETGEVREGPREFTEEEDQALARTLERMKHGRMVIIPFTLADMVREHCAITPTRCRAWLSAHGWKEHDLSGEWHYIDTVDLRNETTA